MFEYVKMKLFWASRGAPRRASRRPPRRPRRPPGGPPGRSSGGSPGGPQEAPQDVPGGPPGGPPEGPTRPPRRAPRRGPGGSHEARPALGGSKEAFLVQFWTNLALIFEFPAAHFAASGDHFRLLVGLSRARPRKQEKLENVRSCGSFCVRFSQR